MRLITSALGFVQIVPDADDLVIQASAVADVIDGTKLHDVWQDIVTATHPDYSGFSKMKVDPQIFLPLDLKRFMAVRVKAVSALEQHGPNCVPAGTGIRMSDGADKPVEQIVVGDTVISHTGADRKVVKLFEYDNHKELLGVRAFGWCDPLWLTADQKVWSLKADEFTVLKREKVYYKTCPTHHQMRDDAPAITLDEAREDLASTIPMRWIEAHELRRNDVVAMQFDNAIEVTEALNQPEIARLMGYYLAEGCRQDNGIVLVTHVDEVNFRSDLDHIAQCLSKPISHVQGKGKAINTVRTVISSGNPTGVHADPHATLIALCEKHCGKYANEKSLSQAVMRMPHAWQQEFLMAYLAGDGSQHGSEYGRYAGTIRGVTSSKRLAQQLQEMMWRMKIHSSVSGRMNPGGFKHAGMIYEVAVGATQVGKLMNGRTHFKFQDMGEGREHHSVALIGDGFVYLPVSRIFKKPHTGKVYDFEVEKDLSYVAGRITVYDSNGDGFPGQELISSHRTLIGKGFYDEHASYNPANALGINAHAEWMEDEHRVLVVSLIDKIRFPRKAAMMKDYLDSKRGGVSIGCIAAEAECSVCGNVARKAFQLCGHMNRHHPSFIKGRRTTSGGLAYDICRNLTFYELSFTKMPADKDALSLMVAGSSRRFAEEKEPELYAPAGDTIAPIPDLAALQKMINRAVSDAIRHKWMKVIKDEVYKEIEPEIRRAIPEVRPQLKEMVEQKVDQVKEAAPGAAPAPSK